MLPQLKSNLMGREVISMDSLTPLPRPLMIEWVFKAPRCIAAPIRAPQSVSRVAEKDLVRRLGSAQVVQSAPPCISSHRSPATSVSHQRGTEIGVFQREKTWGSAGAEINRYDAGTAWADEVSGPAAMLTAEWRIRSLARYPGSTVSVWPAKR
jgi:hypothetical protein